MSQSNPVPCIVAAVFGLLVAATVGGGVLFWTVGAARSYSAHEEMAARAAADEQRRRSHLRSTLVVERADPRRGGSADPRESNSAPDSAADAAAFALLADLFAAADPSPGAAAGPTVHEVLRRAADRMDRVASTDPEAEVSVRLVLGRLLREQDDAARSEVQLRRAIERSPSLQGTGLAVRHELARTLSALGLANEALELLDATLVGLREGDAGAGEIESTEALRREISAR